MHINLILQIGTPYNSSEKFFPFGNLNYLVIAITMEFLTCNDANWLVSYKFCEFFVLWQCKLAIINFLVYPGINNCRYVSVYDYHE